MTIKEILKKGINELEKNNIQEPILQSKILLASIIHESKEYLLIHDDDKLDNIVIEEFEKGINRLIQGEPIQYITGFKEFMGYRFLVNQNVLIPQPDTEILVEEVLKLCKAKDKILDLCTGSGAIAIALSKLNKESKVYASDISLEALKVAKENNKNLNTDVTFIQSDLFNNIEDKFDIIVSNPPYIETRTIETLSKQVQNEPKLALDGGEDGLKFYRKIVAEATNYLNQNGYLCLEIGYNQKDSVIQLIKQSNRYKEIYCKKDLAGNDRIIICRKEG